LGKDRVKIGCPYGFLPYGSAPCENYQFLTSNTRERGERGRGRRGRVRESEGGRDGWEMEGRERRERIYIQLCMYGFLLCVHMREV
jgi:hypothetical protein